ncbi:MAG TPA: DinB family protein [Candidatus Acidoferrales bacterium]|jgi:hypothetical protein|nr:DinB family protein [Candidatus Acidoferrales bacterium]
MKRICVAILALSLVPLASPAQQAPAADATPTAQPEANPVSNGLRKLVATESKDTLEAVEEMPADKFNFRPTPQQNTFGHLVVHMVRVNYGLCSLIAGVKAPKMPDLKDDDPKDTLVGPLKASFDFCNQSLAQLDDSKLGEQLPFFGGRMASRGYLIVTMSEDYGDHYSTAAMYLRLNGLLPPTAQPRK